MRAGCQLQESDDGVGSSLNSEDLYAGKRAEATAAVRHRCATPYEMSRVRRVVGANGVNKAK